MSPEAMKAVEENNKAIQDGFKQMKKAAMKKNPLLELLGAMGSGATPN